MSATVSASASTILHMCGFGVPGSISQRGMPVFVIRSLFCRLGIDHVQVSKPLPRQLHRPSTLLELHDLPFDV